MTDSLVKPHIFILNQQDLLKRAIVHIGEKSSQGKLVKIKKLLQQYSPNVTKQVYLLDHSILFYV